MTPEQIEKHRKIFEEIIKSFRVVKYSLDRNEHDEYRQAAVFHMWNGYLLCAENLEVELPEIQVCYDSKEDKVRHLDYEDTVSLLKRQGIKVKP